MSIVLHLHDYPQYLTVYKYFLVNVRFALEEDFRSNTHSKQATHIWPSVWSTPPSLSSAVSPAVREKAASQQSAPWGEGGKTGRRKEERNSRRHPQGIRGMGRGSQVNTVAVDSSKQHYTCHMHMVCYSAPVWAFILPHQMFTLCVYEWGMGEHTEFHLRATDALLLLYPA